MCDAGCLSRPSPYPKSRVQHFAPSSEIRPRYVGTVLRQPVPAVPASVWMSAAKVATTAVSTVAAEAARTRSPEACSERSQTQWTYPEIRVKTVIEQAPAVFEHARRSISPGQRGRALRRATVKTKLAQACKRLQSAAYIVGGVEWDRVFKRSSSTTFPFEDFRGVVRRDLKISPGELPDVELRIVFNQLDQSRVGVIDFNEIGPLIEGEIAAENCGKSGAPSVHLHKIERMREHLRAVSKGCGGIDWAKSFKRYDKYNTGGLLLADFRSMFRRDFAVLPWEIMDVDIRTFFDHFVSSSTGRVHADDFISFVTRRPTRFGDQAKAPSQSQSFATVAPPVPCGAQEPSENQRPIVAPLGAHQIPSCSAGDVVQLKRHVQRPSSHSPGRRCAVGQDSESSASPLAGSSVHRLQWGQRSANSVSQNGCVAGEEPLMREVVVSGAEKEIKSSSNDAYKIRDKRAPGHFNTLASKSNEHIAQSKKQSSQRLPAVSTFASRVSASSQEVKMNNARPIDCVVHLNVGGERTIEVLLSTLRLFKGSRLEQLFSAGWEERLPRDAAGRIFVDSNADVFVPIIDLLRECRLVDELIPDQPLRPSDVPPLLNFVAPEHEQAFLRALRYFGLEPFLGTSNASRFAAANCQTCDCDCSRLRAIDGERRLLGTEATPTEDQPRRNTGDGAGAKPREMQDEGGCSPAFGRTDGDEGHASADAGSDMVRADTLPVDELNPSVLDEKRSNNSQQFAALTFRMDSNSCAVSVAASPKDRDNWKVLADMHM